MITHHRRAFAPLAASALAVMAALGTVGLSSTSASAADSSSLQPAFTASDHPITDVPGLVNARELGSFTTAGGQSVAGSKLIRSESLDKITPAGASTLAKKYHVALVIDLRTSAQIAAKPDVPVPGAKVVDVSLLGADADYSDDTVMYHDLVDKGHIDASTPGPTIKAYAKVLHLLAKQRHGTVLIHCSHGMDRTGTVVDLLDHVLGVSSSDTLHDYLLSNTQLGVTWATPQLLQSTFETDVATRYGGLDSYISKTLKVSHHDLAELRATYLVAKGAPGDPCHHGKGTDHGARPGGHAI